MGIVRLPSLAEYWSNDELFNLQFPRKVMSRNRFEILLRMIHFADNSADHNNGKLYKINPLVEMLVQSFKSLYIPEEYVCVDETLLPFRGRLGFRQFIKNKRHKYGVKLFKLCSGSGYTYNLSIYAGKNVDNRKTTPFDVVVLLTNDLLQEGRTVVTDNWYTSIQLANKMLDAETHLIGTVRKNRKGIPKEVITKKLKQGELYAKQNERGITVLKWKDTRDVLMLSTKHDDKMVEKEGRRGVKRKPEVVCDYNKGKGSVDLSDQMGAYSNPLRKSLKWYRKVAFELLLTTCMVNAYLLYKEVRGLNITITDFKKSVVKHLASSSESDNTEQNIQRKRRRQHTFAQHEEGNMHKRRKMCKNCYKKNSNEHGRSYATNRTKKVDTYCMDCNNKPSLCLECFNSIHVTNE